jgi:hypothetical protein
MPVFFTKKVLETGLERQTIVGMGNVAGIVL